MVQGIPNFRVRGNSKPTSFLSTMDFQVLESSIPSQVTILVWFIPNENLKRSTECGRESVKMVLMGDLLRYPIDSSVVFATVVPSNYLVNVNCFKGFMVIVLVAHDVVLIMAMVVLVAVVFEIMDLSRGILQVNSISFLVTPVAVGDVHY